MIVICGSGFAGYAVAENIRSHLPTCPITMITDTQGEFFPKPQLSVSFSRKRHADELIVQHGHERAEQLGITLLSAFDIQSIDTKNKLVIGADQTVSYDQLVYALGSSAIHLPIDERAMSKVHTLNTLADYQRLSDCIHQERKPTIGVIGCGFIGYELISSLSQCGIKVSAMHDMPLMLNMLLPEKGQQYATRAVESYVDFYPSFRTTSIRRQDDQVVISDGKKEVCVDEVIVAIGVRSNTEVARLSGMPVDNVGVKIDAWGRVSGFEDVWAVGDCASLMGRSFKYIAYGRYMAGVLAHNLCHPGDQQSLMHKPFPYSVKSEICPISVMGLPRDDLPWVWQEQGVLIGTQSENGQLSAWCLCGDDRVMKASLTKQMLMK